MRRHDIEFQILLEIGHTRSNVRQLRITIKTSTPGASVNRTQHHVLQRLDRGDAGGDDDALQFDLIDDQRFANQTKATRLVQKNESRAAGRFEVDDQREFSNPSRGITTRALREAFANVRVKRQ